MGSTTTTSNTLSLPRRRLPIRPTCGLLLSAGAALVLGGCSYDLDQFLDQSLAGRWEPTPTTTPIIERIAAIEGPADQYVEYDTIRPDDLRPEAAEYRISPGDTLEVRIWDIIIPGQAEIYPLLVDTRGMVTIPQLGEITVGGLTAEQTRETIANATARFVQNPLVQVTVAQSRKQTFTVLGAVGAAGTYFIPSADYRLIEGITAAGGMAETIQALYVIRQIPLEAQPTNPGVGATPAGEGAPQGEQIIDILDSLTDDEGGGSPGVLSSEANSWQPDQPAVDLVEGEAPEAEQPPQEAQNTSAWIFVNGEWVRTTRGDAGAEGQAAPDSLVTQRVIRVPIKPLLAGDARYNIVIRPGDLIRVPPAEQGFIYMGGKILRAGSYNLPPVGPFTLQRAIFSAGGLAPDGVPERCDLTRMVGDNRQATVTLNYRAITEGTQPDIVLKANDIVNIGTNFWAYPLAVIRGGFRTTYGFGFLMDRNFGNDVFGAPPSNNQFQ